MKTQLVLISVLSILLSASHINAQMSVRSITAIPAPSESFSVHLFPDSSEQKLVLVIDNPAGEKLRISISSGTSGFNEVTIDIEYRKRIDMSGADDGEYTLTVVGSRHTFNKKLSLNTRTLVTRDLRL